MKFPLSNSEAQSLLEDEAVRAQAQADRELQSVLEEAWLKQIEPWDGNEDSLLVPYPKGWESVTA